MSAEFDPVALVREALHLRQYGENAPGGTETWAEWDRKATNWAYAEMDVCNGCASEGFRLTFSPEHAAWFCDGCYEREVGIPITCPRCNGTGYCGTPATASTPASPDRGPCRACGGTGRTPTEARRG